MAICPKRDTVLVTRENNHHGNMPKARDTVLVVGATGSLGIPIVAELLRRGHKLRLIGRSKESFTRAGHLGGKSIDIVVCKDVIDRTNYRDTWFADVSCVICVARPRSLKEGDEWSYRPMVENLCNAAISAKVPRVLLHGLPYLERNIAGDSPTMKVVRNAEESAKEIFDRPSNKSSQLTISRICEMSEIGHLLEAARMIGFFPCAVGYNPLLHPVSPRDFAAAVANYVEEELIIKNELLVGGPRQIRWREFGQMITDASKRKLRIIVLPLFVYKLILYILGIFPSLKGMYLCLKVIVIPMTTNTASRDFISVGSDDAQLYIQEQLETEGTTWVHSKLFGGNNEKNSWNGFIQSLFMPSTRSLARLVGILATCDAAVAFLKPAFVGNMQNLDVSYRSIDRHLVQAFGVAASFIALVTIMTVKRETEMGKARTKNAALVGIFGLVFVVAFAHFICPHLVKYSFGAGIEELEEKTLKHAQQISMYYIASALQLLSLASGVRPESAAGVVALVWCMCSTYMWLIVQIANVFEMSPVSRNINLTFPIWSGLLAAGILLRK